MPHARKLTLKILTDQKISLSINIGGADSIDFIFGIQIFPLI